MYNLQINELTPGQKYYVKVRAKAPGYATSEWSPTFEFEAEQDQIPPERVKNLTFTSEGDSFIARWEAPELNMDGTPCTDLSHYNVTLINADASVTTTLQTSTPEFNIDFNRNTQLFGSPSHIIEITVTAVDRVGNEGPGTSKIAQNPPPNKVENVTAQSGVESVTVGWTLGTETDLAAYRIYVSDDASFTPSAATFRGEVASGTDSFAYNTSSFVTQYFRVVAVDKFGATSVPSDAASARPKLTTDYDKTPPGRVLDFTVTQSLASDNNSAVATVTYSSLADTDLDKYELQYRKTGDTVAPWSFASVPSDQTTAEIKPLPLSTDYDFRIRAVDFNANKGAWSAVVVAEGVKKTSLPGAPTDIVASGGATNLMVTWTESADESMASWAGTYEVQISKTSDFNSSITIKTASTLASFTGLEPNTIYYARARSIDPYGNVGPWSEVVDGNTGIVFDPNAPQIYWSVLPPEGGKENDLWIQLPQNIQHRFDGTEWVEAQDLNLIDKIDAVMQSSDSKNRNVYSEEDASGTTLGDYSFIDGDTWYKRDSANTILSMWEFRNGGWVIKTLNDTVISNLDAGKITSGYINAGRIDADTITGEMIASKTIVVGNMAEGSVDQTVIADGAIVTDKIAANAIVATKIDTDAVTADKIKFGEISGDHLAANTAIVNNLEVQSSVTINGVNGHIKSENYTANGTAGFYMDQQQLIINEGKIKAAAIELQDSANIMPPLYASFNANSSAYEVAKFWRGSLSGTTKVANDGKFGGGSVQFVITSNTGFVGMGASATDLNIPIEGGNQYIVSFYVSNRSNKAITLQPELYQTSAITIKGTATSIANSTAWTRYSVVVTAPATMTRAILRFNLTTGATATFKLDGIQVEQKTGAIDTPSNWSPPGYTSIDGESITTGSISSSTTARTNSAIAAWSIDTQGRARFGDVTVNGKIIVGEEVSNKEATSIQSDTYSAGTAGWAIKGNGDVEFNDGTFRGILNLGTSVNESVKPTMTASVSSIKLYTDETTSKDIDVASIQGVTYAYSRTDQTQTGTFVPDLPNENKAARYYFGPTTDKAVNIQVHDGQEDRAVYVSNPPVGVTLTSLRIGELTNPGAPALDREKQGFGYVSTRAETDPDTPNRKTSIRVEQSSGVQLRSPFYPEVTEGKEYPESTHILRTEVDFKAPLSKNLIHFSTALPDEDAYRSVVRTGRTDYSAWAYEMRNVIGKAAHFDVSAGTATATKKHIFSTYVDTLDATDDVAIYAFANGTPLKPLGDNVLQAGQTGYEYAPDYRSPDYRYEFETSATSYSNVGTGTQALTITQGTPYLDQPGALNASNIRYTAAANYSLTSGMSLSMWIRPDPSSGTQVIFHRATDTTREIWISYEAGTRTFSGGLSTGTAWEWTATNNLVPDEWTHVTIVIPPATSTTGNIVIYINGDAKWTSATIPTNRWNLSFSTQPYYLFGNMQLNSFYRGGISEPMIFHRMIQPADVSAIYNSGSKVLYLTGGNATQSQNGILVGTGSESNRVAFEYTPTTSTATNVKVQIVGPTGNKVFIYKLQLEKASHLENNSLSQDIRNRVAPTPWTTNGSSATSSAALTLRSEPATDAESWTYGSLVKAPRGVTLTEEASARKSPAELELTLSSSYTYTGGPSAGMIAGATYKWSTAGVSYPGSPFPYLPTAAKIYWDYTDLTYNSRPQIGGSSAYLRRTVNEVGSSLGAISIGVGRSIRDNFNRSDESTLGYPWMREGNPAFYLINNYTRRRAYGGVQTGIPENFVYHSDQLETINQEVSIKSSDSSANFTTWRNNTVLICNYDPGSGDGIFFRNKDHSADRKWELIVRAEGVITYSTGGTYSTAMSDGTVLTLSRDGNRLTAKKGSTTYFNSTVSATLPTGRAVGFATDSGINDDFVARDLVPGSTAHGSLRPESINVNNNRGISVRTNGMITVNAPGYYMLTATVGADFGGHIDRTYWLTAREWVRGYISGGYRDHRLGGPQNRGVNDFSYISGSVVAYMTGSIELVVETDTDHVSRIDWAEMQLVRVA